MKPILVPDRLTPLKLNEAIAAFAHAYETVTGEAPTCESLTIIVAQSALETGQWKSMHCYNYGNVKAGRFPRGRYTQFKCNEIIDGKEVWFSPPEWQCSFKAYESAADGAAELIRFLAVDTTPYNGKPNRYESAWDELEAGNLPDYVSELADAGYFTASRSLYLKGMQQLYAQFMPSVLLHGVKPIESKPLELSLEQRLDDLEQWRVRVSEA